jgi:hypothetical protein
MFFDLRTVHFCDLGMYNVPETYYTMYWFGIEERIYSGFLKIMDSGTLSDFAM